MVKSQTATFRVMRKGRESSEGRGPSAGRCSVLRAREESWLEVSSPSSKGPSHLATCPQGRCTPGGDLKRERTGRSSDPAFKHSHPTSAHPAMPTTSSCKKYIQCATKKCVLTTDRTEHTLMGQGGFFLPFLRVHIF